MSNLEFHNFFSGVVFLSHAARGQNSPIGIIQEYLLKYRVTDNSWQLRFPKEIEIVLYSGHGFSMKGPPPQLVI